MELGFYFFIAAGLYFLPSWIGSEKQNRSAIFWLNVLLGWTIIGWVVALVWALTKEPSGSIASNMPPPAPERHSISLPADPDARAARLKDLRDRGAITQEEFLDLISRS